MPKHNKMIKVRVIDEDAGFIVVHQRWKMPWMLSNRSFFNTYYHVDGCEPGEYQFITSGHGNEDFVRKHAACAGKDVIGEMNINYIGIRPARNFRGEIYGTFLQQVQSINPAGMIMEWMKTKIARKQATNILKMIEYLQSNEILEYEKFVSAQDRFKERDDGKTEDFMITTERQLRPSERATRMSVRQSSTQHFYHK